MCRGTDGDIKFKVKNASLYEHCNDLETMERMHRMRVILV